MCLQCVAAENTETFQNFFKATCWRNVSQQDYFFSLLLFGVLWWFVWVELGVNQCPVTGKWRILKNRITSCVLKSEPPSWKEDGTRAITKINSSSLRWRKVTSCTKHVCQPPQKPKKKKRDSHRAFESLFPLSTPSPSSLFRCLSTSRILYTSTASKKK